MKVIKRKTDLLTYYIFRNEKCYTHVSNRVTNLYSTEVGVATEEEQIKEVYRLAGLMKEKILDIEYPIVDGDEIVEI